MSETGKVGSIPTHSLQGISDRYVFLLCKEKVNQVNDSKRNCRKIKCSRCKKNILFSRTDVYEGENEEKYVQCEICGHENRLKKLK